MPVVLAVFAHPDDAELLAGGTLRLLVERGWKLRVVTACNGNLGSMSLTREEIASVRLGEARKAAATLGGDHEGLGFGDFELAYGPAQLPAVVDAVRRADPDLVVTHSPSCYLPDHEECARLVRMACFAAPVPLYATATPATRRGVPALVYSDALEHRDMFGNPVGAEFRVDVTSSFAVRQAALACHASQRDWLRAQHGIDEYLLASERQAAHRGRECGVAFAEGFRRHLGHGYPRTHAIADALGPLAKPGAGLI